jgi:trehalose/maltose hydrolase-like predicted phosphorylase
MYVLGCRYWQMTQNRSALRELFPLLEGVSDFVVSRANRTDAQGWLSVENIVASDESTGRKDVNNDIFTNAAGVLALEVRLWPVPAPALPELAYAGSASYYSA